MAVGLLLASSLVASAQMRQEYLLTSNWEFAKGDVPNAASPSFKDAKWQTVSVPHDWATYEPFDGKNDCRKLKLRAVRGGG